MATAEILYIVALLVQSLIIVVMAFMLIYSIRSTNRTLLIMVDALNNLTKAQKSTFDYLKKLDNILPHDDGK